MEIYSKEAEEALLGSLMINPELMPEIVLSPDNFYIARHKWIFAAMQELNNRGVEFDLITLSEELREKMKEIGGQAYLTELIAQSPMSYNATYYADIIRDKASRRGDLLVANMIATGAHNGGVDRAKAIDMLTKNTQGKGARLLSDGLGDFVKQVEERSKDPKDVWGISTGLPDLDVRLGGMQRQQTTMLVGAPGVGKTTLMLQISLHMAQAGSPGTIYELEMDYDRIVSRLILMLTGVPTRAMKSGRMEEHWTAFTQGLDILGDLKLYITDNPVMDTMTVRADVAKMKSQNHIEWVSLDYLNLLTDKDGDSKNDDTTAKATRFRRICREFDVAGLTIQSVNKEGMKAIIPHLADMSGPAEVAFSADNVLFLVQDPDKPQNEYKLLPAKQRDGDKGSSPIELVKPKNQIKFGCKARY